MNDNTFTWTVVGVAAVLLVGGVFFFGNRTGADDVTAVAGAQVGVEENNHDWGNIPINGGNVVKQFKVTNKGSELLTLSDVESSCMCTTAQFVKGSERSPVFRMHAQSNYKMELMPGEEAQLEVVFDPAFHGPTGLGQVTRQIVMNTSDPNSSRLQFNLRGVVVK